MVFKEHEDNRNPAESAIKEVEARAALNNEIHSDPEKIITEEEWAKIYKQDNVHFRGFVEVKHGVAGREVLQYKDFRRVALGDDKYLEVEAEVPAGEYDANFIAGYRSRFLPKGHDGDDGFYSSQPLGAIRLTDYPEDLNPDQKHMLGAKIADFWKEELTWLNKQHNGQYTEKFASDMYGVGVRAVQEKVDQFLISLKKNVSGKSSWDAAQ